ncbi:MAG: DMT family transporter [Paracoccaceae bacterium]
MNALVLGLIAAVAWGFHDICVRFVSQKTPLMASLLFVLLTGLAFHLGVMIWANELYLPTGKGFWHALVSGFFFLMASLGLYGAFQRGPVRLVSPIIASYPILSLLWAAFSGAEISTFQWCAVLLIIVGVSTVAALSDTTRDKVPPRGRTICYASIAAIGFAGTFAFGQSAAVLSGELPATLVARLAATACLIAIIGTLGLPLWPGKSALPVLGLMGLADGLALLCVMSAGGLPDAQFAAVAASTFGLLTIVMAWLWLGEHMRVSQWIGCAIAFFGIGYLAL